MFCKYCGNRLIDNSKFCSACGNAVDVPVKEEPCVSEAPVVTETPAAPAPVYVQPPVQPQAPAENQRLISMQNSILTNGILGLALALSIPFMSFIGIIFGAIGMNKAKEYIDLTGETPARVTVGKGLGKAGVITGIAMSAFWTLYFIFIIFIFSMNMYY